MTAEEFWQEKNGGASSEDLTMIHGVTISPMWAVALMEEFAQINLREELIKYDKWMARVKWGTDVPSAEKAVDEYLKTKNQ